MTEQEWREQLEKEGFKDIDIVEFSAKFTIPEHTHNTTTVHVILGGDMSLYEQKEDHIKVDNRLTGDKFEILAGTTHYVTCGENGCRFMVGVHD